MCITDNYGILNKYLYFQIVRFHSYLEWSNLVGLYSCSIKSHDLYLPMAEK